MLPRSTAAMGAVTASPSVFHHEHVVSAASRIEGPPGLRAEGRPPPATNGDHGPASARGAVPSKLPRDSAPRRRLPDSVSPAPCHFVDIS
jgi:hypothetical protein